MLGERIRKIRKQKKLTLEALAGEGLTKGMLSLIENNKAKPSMESLAHIADGLGVEVSDLLEEVSAGELREILDQAEQLFNQEGENLPDKNQKLIILIGPYIGKLQRGYESARLLEIYSRCLYREKIAGWEEFCDQAATIYDEINLTAKRAAIAIFRSSVKFIEHKYSQALEVIKAERAEIEQNHAYIDPMTTIDLDYHEAISYFSVGDYETATVKMESAIEFSKKHRIFYRIDDLYRLGAGQILLSEGFDKNQLYLQKLKQYGEFADDLRSLIVYDLIIAMSLNVEHRYSQALEILERYFADPEEKEIFEDMFLIEKGKSLYGLGYYSEAISILEKVETPSTTHHPFDLSIFYVRFAYLACCYDELGRRDEALQFAKKAVELFDTVPRTPFKNFAMKTYQTLTSN